MTNRILAIVLSGGAGQRFAGKDKGLQPFKGKPLVQCVIEVVAPQVDDLIISANRNLELYNAFDYPVVADSSLRQQGPMAGILAVLDTLAKRTETNAYGYALICPCDSPSLPTNYVQRLLQALRDSNAPAALVNDGIRKQNLHCLIKQEAWHSLANYFQDGGRAMHRWHKTIGVLEVDFSDQSKAFININFPEQLE